MQPVIPQPSALDLAMIVARRKWSALLVFSVALMGAIVWIFLIRDEIYETSARVMVKIGREMAAPSTVIGGVQPVISNRSPDVNTEIDILQSTELIARVVDEMHLDVPLPPKPPPDSLIPKLRYYAKSYWRGVKDWSENLMITAGLRERLSPREKTIEALQKALVIKPPKDSYVILVTLYLPAREGAGRVLNQLIQDYLEYRTTLYQERTAVPVFRSETGQREAELRKSEAELEAFETSGGISSLEKQKEVLLGEIAQAGAALRNAELARREAGQKLDRLQAELRSPEPNFAALGEFDEKSFIGNLLLQLAVLQKEREQLRLTELDSGARIRNNRDQFAALIKLALSNLQSVVGEKEASMQARAAALESLQANLAHIHALQSRWTELKRDATVREGSYLFYGKKLEEASANATLSKADVSNVVVVQNAMDPLAPFGIRKTTLLEVSLGVALLAALAWVSILEFFDRGIYTAGSLEKYLGVPVIAAIPFGNVQKTLDAPGKDAGLKFRIYAAGDQ